MKSEKTVKNGGKNMALIDVVKFNGLSNRDWLVYKHYAEDLSTATQLIVNEGQAAVFIKGGQICDIFGPGTYTLSTANIPILNKLVNLPFGGKTPFSAEIYYVNTATKLDIQWGTSDPIPLVDPKYHVRLRVRAFGQAGLKIADIQYFIKEVIGSMSPTEVVNYTKVADYFKGVLVSKVKSLIADVIINEGISALEISAKLDTISERIENAVASEFREFGINIVNLHVKSINFPDDDFERINKILEEKAAFDIMGDSRYVTKRSFDVYEGAANNQNGVAGAFVAGGVGIGAGMAMGGGMQSVQAPSPQVPATVKCSKCNAELSADAKFCHVCGSPAVRKNVRNCPHCSAEIADGSKFCPNCGANVEERVCECGNKLVAGAKFCPNCGKKVE